MARNATEYPAPWTDAELEPYKAYPELYNERKYANYTTPRSRASLSAFPPEIRLQILSYILPLPTAIDITTTYLTPSRYTTLLRPRLALIRLNRTIGAEARATFYGLNEFRFTTRAGGAAPPRAQWLLLAAFMGTIGVQGYQHLRHVVVDAPLRFEGGGERAWDPLVLAALRDDVRDKAPGLLPELDNRLGRAVGLGEREERLERRDDQAHCRNHRDVFVWEWLDRLCAAMRRRLEVAVVLQHGDYVSGLSDVLKHVPVLLEAKRRGYAVGHATDDDGEAGGEYEVTFDDYVMEDLSPTWSLAVDARL
ncbi:hypothetical protein UCDDS831_g04823 [Diplodia seriata]|uniref:F-box domain-containing protein n=1 Tax=Diplodia seriata TaxID=420778 RepID=A0A0G2ECY6_9PEZI|nr:hypothetical protein UCDDS831_g04823 [Diplodia seriata]